MLTLPPSLQPGDTIAIVSPATTVKPEYIDGAVRFLHSKGFNPVIGTYAKGPSEGSYAASLDHRLADFNEALRNCRVKAILCARGGYGCIHLLSGINIREVAANPKWLIGFSDVSALHALWNAAGVASIHGPMAKHLATLPDDDFYSDMLVRMLCNGGGFDVTTTANPHDRHGRCSGILRGGNLAVLNSLGGTPYDMLHVGENEDVILFFEDISEKIYAVERMLSRLAISGTLHNVKGLIFGQFTEYQADRNFNSMEEMIVRLLDRCNLRDIPVVFDFPVGHVDENHPLTLGIPVTLESNSSFRRLRTL